MNYARSDSLLALSLGSLIALCETTGAWRANATPPERIVIAQADGGASALDKLREQSAVGVRQKAIVPAATAAGGATSGPPGLPAVDPKERDKVQRVQKLVDEIAASRGAALGTVTVVPESSGLLALQHDLFKARGNVATMGNSPFTEFGRAESVPNIPNISAVVMPAAVEYRMTGAHDGGEQVVGVKSGNDLAASAFKSGEKPVTLDVQTANLTAQQVPGPDQELEVNVQVSGSSRLMRPGEAARFGTTEVLIQASTNYSTKKSAEGPPYALRLRIRTIP
jgi:hypothetical protein